MKNIFFIAGLPRSRTAWLANFLTYGNSFCYHEGLIYCKTLRDLKSLLIGNKAEIVGNSDSGLCLIGKELKEMFPEAKMVVIARDKYHVRASLDKNFPGLYQQGWLDRMLEGIDEIQDHFKPLIMRYDTLKNRGMCKMIWDYCIPDQEFDFARWKMLDKLNVSVIPERSIEEAKKCQLQQH